jgi:phosphoglycerate dehydrogenase-like enzyme
MPSVVVLQDFTADRLATLRQRLGAAWNVVAIPDRNETAAITRALAEADAVVAFEFGRDRPPAPLLRLLQVSGAGYDRIDFAALPPGCAVCNVHEHEIGIAEYTLLGMLEWTIGLRGMDQRLRQGDWLGSFHKPDFHGELYGKTLGIVGYGHIGREVALRARAFGMRIGAITRTPRPSELTDWAAPMSELDARLPDCDFVLVACPLDATTRGLFNRQRFAAMKPSSVLLNVGRGEVAEEDALYEALRDRTIAGAVIDTWYVYPTPANREPLPSRRPFHELPNVIMSPHASGCTDKLLDRRWLVMTENLQRLAAGQALRNVVRPTAS